MHLKPFMLAAFFLLNFWALHAQQKFPKKIKVVLLGTFHYGETSDRNSTSFNDLFSEKRQHELDVMARMLYTIKPSKLFVEVVPERQQRVDSLYQLYRENTLKDTVILKNEIEQIAFRLCKLAHLAAPRCVDFRQELPYDAMEKFEHGTGADTTIQFPPFFSIDYPFTDSTKKLSLGKMALAEYYKLMNSPYHREKNQFDYLHYALSYGYKADYTGADFTAAWYSRNLKIFTNILRQLQPEDNCIVILFGASHTNTIRQFVENHPSFEIVELESVFR